MPRTLSDIGHFWEEVENYEGKFLFKRNDPQRHFHKAAFIQVHKNNPQFIDGYREKNEDWNLTFSQLEDDISNTNTSCGDKFRFSDEKKKGWGAKPDTIEFKGKNYDIFEGIIEELDMFIKLVSRAAVYDAEIKIKSDITLFWV